MGFLFSKMGSNMLKYKCEDTVAYFVYENQEYRRIDGAWEMRNESKWEMVEECALFETAYKKRCKIKELIKSKDRLKKEIGIYSNNELNKKYTHVVQELMKVFGTMVFVDYTSEQLMRILDEGKLLIMV